MALLNHIAAAPASLPPTDVDRIEALRAALIAIACGEAHGPSMARAALDADARAAAAQDEAQAAIDQCPVYGWQPGGLIRELGDRPTDPMEPLR